jgi:molybdopterin-binding protein
MTQLRISEAAALLQVSDDTVRRWADAGRLSTTTDDVGRAVVEGAELARFMSARAAEEPALESPVVSASARNRLVGIVTRVVRDTVMAQVELQVGPHRIVSLMSREAADELALEPGVLAVATVKSTNVGIEIPEHR